VRLKIASAVILVALALGGCGNGGSDTGPTGGERKLTASEEHLADSSQRAIYAYCRRIARFEEGTANRVPPAAQERAFKGVDDLVALGREHPRAKVSTGLVGERVLLRVRIGDIAEDLEATNCDPTLVGRIDQGLATIPVR
jgi:hypothetical protein